MAEIIERAQKIKFAHLKIGESIMIHAGRIATFKSTVSRYNKTASPKFAFDYKIGEDSFFTATRKPYIAKLKVA